MGSSQCSHRALLILAIAVTSCKTHDLSTTSAKQASASDFEFCMQNPQIVEEARKLFIHFGSFELGDETKFLPPAASLDAVPCFNFIKNSIARVFARSIPDANGNVRVAGNFTSLPSKIRPCLEPLARATQGMDYSPQSHQRVSADGWDMLSKLPVAFGDSTILRNMRRSVTPSDGFTAIDAYFKKLAARDPSLRWLLVRSADGLANALGDELDTRIVVYSRFDSEYLAISRTGVIGG